MVTELRGQRAIVTGAASGIGAATVRALEQSGAKVVGIDRAFEGRDDSRLQADISSKDAVSVAIAAAARTLGGIDILVNAAGVYQEAVVGEIRVEDYDRIFGINVLGTILVTQASLPHMSAGGRIINLASELAILGRERASVYAASKGAIISLTRSWARELAPKLLVNAIAPGPTDTPLLGFDRLTPEQRELELSNPMHRIGRPEEVAHAIVFLASPRSTFITGHCLNVDGGSAMH